MPDVYATIGEADESVQEGLADVLELRASDPQQRAMLDAYLSDLAPGEGSRVLELGSGTGAVTRVIRELPGVREAVGVDPSPVFVERARELSAGFEDVGFEVGDARRLELDDESFDAIVLHTSLCHIPGPGEVLTEAFRVCRAGGSLAVFDGDYATTTVAIRPKDPLQECVEASVEMLVHDRWLARGLAALVAEAGWEGGRARSHGYLAAEDPRYMLTLIDRGADFLADDGSITAEEADARKREARRRLESHEFFGFIAYMSLIATRP